MEKILEKLTYGHYIVTTRKPSEDMSTRDKDYIAAGSVNWVTQLSFEPLSIGVGIQLHSDLNETIEKSRNFTIHILGEGHEKLIEKFAGDTNVTAGEINKIDFTIGENGAPVLEKGIGYLECEVTDRVTVGDHSFFIGKVVDHKLDSDSEPLCTMQTKKYYKG